MPATQLEEYDALWDRFVQYGAPLTANSVAAGVPSAERLPAVLDAVVQNLQSHPQQCDGRRKREALEALLLALWIHYPTCYRSLLQTHAGLADWLPGDITGRHIKLKRIAAAALASYL